MPDLTAAREELKQLIGRTIAEGPVKLASGKMSDFYIDGRLTTLSGRGLELMSRLFYERIKALNVVAVGGPTMGADPVVAGIIMESARQGAPLSGFLIRKEPKGHGMQRWVEGPALADGARVVVVEDVVTSGGSALKAIEGLRTQYKPNIVKIMALVDRMEGAQEALTKAGFEFEALFSRRDFGR
ncbi:orotate phosphoribosyltransferase [bacterium]|nr:MAG: orotate phosphoribosyltransferase [bacterium]RIK62774.1 MAG: orotate phosphoribosyltransferase [Planctomycetota bacterium]